MFFFRAPRRSHVVGRSRKDAEEKRFQSARAAAPSIRRALDTLKEQSFTRVKCLIVNADDFGLTPGINSAVAELNQAGALTSTTMMASSPCFQEASRIALAQSALAIGCHVVLTDGSPVLPAGEVHSLIDPEKRSLGRFRPSLASFVRDLMLGRIRPEEIEAEAIAQIRRVQSCGIHVTHLDTHKHTHTFRGVREPLIRAAQSCGVRAMRNPFEPGWSLHATPRAGILRQAQVRALCIAGKSFARLARQSGIATTDGSIGMLATGTLDRLALRSLIQAIPDGAWELICHPGYRDTALDETATRLRTSREIERQALLETIPPLHTENSHFRLIDFRYVAHDKMG